MASSAPQPRSHAPYYVDMPARRGLYDDSDYYDDGLNSFTHLKLEQNPVLASYGPGGSGEPGGPGGWAPNVSAILQQKINQLKVDQFVQLNRKEQAKPKVDELWLEVKNVKLEQTKVGKKMAENISQMKGRLQTLVQLIEHGNDTLNARLVQQEVILQQLKLQLSEMSKKQSANNAQQDKPVDVGWEKI